MAGNAPYWSHQATFEASPISASQARVFVSRHLIEHRPLYLVDPVRLVMSELATNSLVHAQTGFTVTLAGLDDTVLLTVRDDSLAFPTRRAAQTLDPGGSRAGDCRHCQSRVGDQRGRGRFQGGLGVLRHPKTSRVLGTAPSSPPPEAGPSPARTGRNTRSPGPTHHGRVQMRPTTRR
jgi:hypothetical protein